MFWPISPQEIFRLLNLDRCRKATTKKYLFELEINNVVKENHEKLEKSDGFALFSAGAVCYSLKTYAGLCIFFNCG